MRAAGTALLALQMLAAGCVGPSEPLSIAAADPAEAMPALSLILHVASDSVVGVRVLTTAAEPTVPGLWLDQPTIHPGEYEAVMAVALDRSSTPWTGRLHIELHDGVGTRTVAFELGPWSPLEDTTAVVTLRLSRPGVLQVAAMKGPVREIHSEPEYGRILWPTGVEAPLHDFPHTVWVPEGHPRLWSDEPARYRVDAAAAQWVLDGTVAARGPEWTAALGPGAHLLELRVPASDGLQSASFRVTAAERWSESGTIALPQPRALQPVADAWEHAWEVRPGNRFHRLVLAPAPETPHALLDLYVLGADGGVVAHTDVTEPGEQSLEFQALPSGTYTLQVYSRDTVNAGFVLSGVTEYS